MEDLNEIVDQEMGDYDLKEKAKKDAKEPLRKINIARNYVSRRDNQLKENMAFYQGNPYVLAQYKENRPWVIQMNTPYAAMAIDTRAASLSASDYVGKLQPFTAEDAESVNALQGVYEDEWERSNMNPIIDDCITNAAVVRESYVHVIIDLDKKRGGRPGEIEAYMLDTMSVYIDPRARRYEDARYVVIASRIPYEEAIELYPEFKALLPKGTSVQPDERGEKYLDNDYTTGQEDIITMFTMYEKDNKKITKKVILEDMLVESTVLKGLKRLPVAQLRWKKAAQSAYGFSLMDDLLSLQKAISSIESAITNTAVAYASPSIIVRKGSGINPKVVAKTAGAPGVVYVSDIPISEAMASMSPAKIDDKIVNLKQDFENTIDKISGITNPFIGQIGTAGNTATGSQIAVERSKIVESAVLTNISEFVEYLTMLFIDYITFAYAGSTITNRKMNETSGKFEFKNRYVPESIAKTEFSYYIDLESKTPYNKDRERDAILQIYQMERQYDSPIKLINEMDILAKYSVSNKDELVDRYKLLTKQTVEAKAATITKLNIAAQQYGVDQQLLLAAIAEVIEGGKETPAMDQFMATAQQMSARVQQEAQASEDDLAAQGIDPQFIQAAKEQSGAQPTAQNLNLTQ